MAEKKSAAVKELEKQKKGAAKRNKSKGLGIKGILFFTFASVAGVIFMPTSMLLFVGMLPSMVAFFVSGTGRGARASTVAAMNIAGCLPFVFKLWAGENDFDSSLRIISSSQSIMVMYMAAAFGYLIDWVVTGVVSSFLYQKGVNRMKAIKERQAALVENWGEGVRGKTIQK